MSVPDGFSGGTWSAIVFVGGGNALGQLFVTCRCVYYASVSFLIGSADLQKLKLIESLPNFIASRKR